MDGYEQLILKLNDFIKKYYKIKLVRGLILVLTFFFAFVLISSLSEFFIHFSVTFRTIIFFGFLFLFLFVVFTFIIIPILKLINLSKRISYFQASEIIQKHFPDVKDKLINILELKSEPSLTELIKASIEQKSDSIKLFPFVKAVNHKQNLKYLKYLIPVLFIFLLIYSIFPSVISESSRRIVNYSSVFNNPAPFSFVLQNDTLQTERGKDFTIQLKIIGNYIPDEVFIHYAGNDFLMTQNKKQKSNFSYEFKNLNNTLEFYFSAQELNSPDYKLEVLPSPTIIGYTVNVNVPDYTGEQDTTYTNMTDIVVPTGSVLSWSFKCKNIDSLCLFEDNKKVHSLSEKSNFSLKNKIFKNLNYSVSVANKYFLNKNLIKFNIIATPDLYPSISVLELKDSVNYFIAYYKGQINDDYGINKLLFKFRIVPDDTKLENTEYPYETNYLQYNTNNLKQDFYYSFDFSTLKINDNQEIQYYFEVWDNDGISGSKSSKSQIMTFQSPSFKEIKDAENTTNTAIKEKLDRSIKITEEIQRDIQKLRERNIDGNTSDWENKQLLDNIFQKQNLLKQLTEQIAVENNEKNKMHQQFSEENNELLKKQEEIQKLLDELMTDELKELMKQLQQLQEKFNKDMMNKLLEENEFSYKEMSDRLERTKELLKKEQVEQKINSTIDELNKLSEDQENLSNKNNDKGINKEELLKQQKEIEEKFNQLMDDYKKTEELNKELKSPLNMDNFSDEKIDIKNEFQNSKKELENGKNKKASESQKNNAQNMKKMAESMDSMMNSNSSQQKGEDIESLRKILDNLIRFSFSQEDLKDKFTLIRNTDPKYIEFSEKQLALKEDFSIINDSLKSLAERVQQISKPILDELYNININLSETEKVLKRRDAQGARNLQNKVMTSSNNLALLLSEIMNQMKNQQQSGGSGSGKQNPKDGKQNAMQDLKGMQESLKKQLEKMLKEMSDKEGDQKGKGQNKELAKMLAQQEIFRQMMQEMNAKFSLNPETQKLLREIDKLIEENEKDIVNKRITPEFINRQKEIETRLLEAEKAEKNRKTEEKRKSEQGKDRIYKSPEDVFKEQSKYNRFQEDLYRNNIRLNSFYKNLYDEYSKSISK